MCKTRQLKKILLFLFILSSLITSAQKIESLHVNLYTDSLKKGTFNYINIDGQLANGRYIPLDSTHLIFQASAGKFNGNSLWIDRDIAVEKVNIKVMLRKDPAMFREFSIYIKKQPDPELKTMDEIMKKSKDKNQKGKR